MPTKYGFCPRKSILALTFIIISLVIIADVTTLIIHIGRSSEKLPTSAWRWTHSLIKARECACAPFDRYQHFGNYGRAVLVWQSFEWLDVFLWKWKNIDPSSNIRFWKAIRLHNQRKLDVVYRNSAPSFTTVKFWVAEFKGGRTTWETMNVQDVQELQPLTIASLKFIKWY